MVAESKSPRRLSAERVMWQAPIDRLVERLERAVRSDAKAERIDGIAGVIAIVCAVASFFLFGSHLLIAIGLFSGAAIAGWIAYKESRRNLDDRKLASALQFLKIVRADTPVERNVRLGLDFRPYQRSGRKLQSEGGSWFASSHVAQYQQPWLRYAGPLADGAQLRLEVTDRVTRKEKRKRKYTKVRERTRSTIELRLRLRPKGHPPVERIAELLRGRPGPSGSLSVKSIRARGRTLAVALTSEPAIRVRHAGASSRPIHNEVTGHHLLQSLMWVYDGVNQAQVA